MWMFVVAAGSGYLARCLQSSSSIKRPRFGNSSLIEDPNDRPLPQEATDNGFRLSEEALRFKEQFEKLSLEDNKPEADHGSNDALEVPSMSFERGYHDAAAAASSGRHHRHKSKAWSTWPRSLKGNRSRRSRGESPSTSSADDYRIFTPTNDNGIVRSETGTKDDEITSFEEKFQLSDDFRRCNSRDHEAHIGQSLSPESITLKTPLTDIFSNASKDDSKGSPQDAFADIGNIFDWTSVAFDAHERRPPVARRRLSTSRLKSTDTSTPATPRSTASAAPLLPGLDVFQKKRKASPRRDKVGAPRISVKELLFFAMGLRAGVSCLLLCYKMNNMNLHRLEEQGADRMNHGVTAEPETAGRMKDLEAELEAELEILELNFKEQKPDADGNASTCGDTPRCSDGCSYSNWTLSPRELRERLEAVLAERQEDRIKELEAELKVAEEKLVDKENELCSWKELVDRLKAISLASVSENEGSGDANHPDRALERPATRRRWFSHPSTCHVEDLDEDRSTELKTSFAPETPEEVTTNEVHVAASNTQALTDSDDASQVFREFLQTSKDEDSTSERASSPEDEPYRRHSTACTVPFKRDVSGFKHASAKRRGRASAEVHQESRIKEERLIYVNTNPMWNFSTRTESRSFHYGCRQTQVIRTVETNCRVEERQSLARFQDRDNYSRRHSTGTAKQRKRWFS